ASTFLTRNMQVLVYGEWENQTKNIKSFFTATYSEQEKMANLQQSNTVFSLGMGVGAKFLFVGTLSEGKQPLYAVQIAARLHKQGIQMQLEICGEGILRRELETYIKKCN